MWDIFLTFTFVSIPEEAFIALLYIGLSKEYSLFKKGNRYKLATLIIMPAVLMNVLMALQIDKNIKLLLCMTSYFVLMSVFNLVGSKQKLKKLFLNLLFVILTFIVFVISETLCIVFMMRVLSHTMQELNNSIYLTILATSFERVCQYIFLYFLFFGKLGKKFNEVSVGIKDVFKFIRYSRIASFVAIILLIASLPTLIFIGYEFMVNDILTKFNPFVQIGLCAALVLIPASIVLLLLEFSRIAVLNTKSYTTTLSVDVKEQAIHALKCAKSGERGATEEAIMGIINSLDFAEDE